MNSRMERYNEDDGVISETRTSKNRNLYETIVNEQNRGLSKDSFYIDNNPMLFEKSETIKKKLENIEDQISSWKENILSIAEEKRTEEIEELKRKVVDETAAFAILGAMIITFTVTIGVWEYIFYKKS